MIVKGIPPILIFWKGFKLARKKLPMYTNKVGRKGYPLPARIGILLYLELYHLTPERGYREIKLKAIHKKLGLRQMPSVKSIYRWRKELAPMARRLLRKTFYLAYKRMGIKALTVIADGSGVKKGRGTQYYEWRLEEFKGRGRRRGKRKQRRPRKKFVRLVMSYTPEIDMIFEITATPSLVGELKAFETGHLPDIISAGIFNRFIADKLYDSENLVRRLRDAGIDVYIPAREGKLRPKPGTPRYIASRNYERLRRNKHLRNLVESAYSSLKSRALPHLTNRSWESCETTIVLWGLIFNLARLHELGIL